MEVKYFSSSWNDIKNSPGWFGKICLLGLINLIPVFGNIVTYGYSWGWARDIAWDVHRPMPKSIFGNEDGKLYSRGFFALLVIWICSCIYGILGGLLPKNGFVTLILFVLFVALCLLANVAIIRESIYARYSAGFQINKVWAMAMHDWKGLLRILGMVLIITCIFTVIMIVILMTIVVALLVAGFAGVGSALGADALNNFTTVGLSDSDIMHVLTALLPVIGAGVIMVLILVYVASCVGVWISLMEARAVGYWARQFEVDKWQGQDDPMPFERAEQAAASVQTAPPVAGDQSAPNAVVPQAMTYGDRAPMEAAVLVVDKDTAPFAEAGQAASGEQVLADVVDASQASVLDSAVDSAAVPQTDVDSAAAPQADVDVAADAVVEAPVAAPLSQTPAEDVNAESDSAKSTSSEAASE